MVSFQCSINNQQISQARELGIFENQNCLMCHLESIPQDLGDIWYDFHMLSLAGILHMCAGQNSFQALCTRTIESTLSGML